MTSQDHECSVCHGTGSVFKDKDKCKKCKGLCVVETKKFLELYIPPGAREGDKIVLAGEADQRPEQEPGNLVFHLTQEPHAIFRRSGHDLSADIHVSLAEALTGFERVVVTHLDGRGISIAVTQPKGRILKPDQVLKVTGEGMPIKKSAGRGDLYLVVKIDFPADGWLTDDATLSKLRAVLPKNSDPIPSKPDVVDDVEYDGDASLDTFGASGGDGDAAWTDDEDSEEEVPGTAQCPTQ
jgi:DnaJ family protein A protein 2